MQPESTTPTRDDFAQAIQRCAEAYHHVRAELPKKAYYHDNLENQQKAALAYLAQLPILCDLASFQIYVACIAQGVGIGAVDIVDAGRLCHIAQTAMSAWKLANLTVPAAKKKEKEEARKQENEACPLPPKGNHAPGEQARQAAARLPDSQTQMALYKSLRQRGIPVPSEQDLRNNPLVALYFCDLAKSHIDKLPPRRDTPDPEPAQEPLQQPPQAA